MASPDLIDDLLHSGYQAYLDEMFTHGVDFLALSFDAWVATL